MKVRYSVRARLDLEDISEYLGARNPTAAKRVLVAIRRSIDLLRAFPRRGRKQKSMQVRRIGAGKHPYNIYYRIEEAAQVVIVLSIYHAARRPMHEDC